MAPHDNETKLTTSAWLTDGRSSQLVSVFADVLERQCG